MASTPADAPKTEAPAGQSDIDDILSSIRSGVEEGGSKVGENDDLLQAAADAEGAEVAPETTVAEEDDILELSADEMVPEGESSAAEEADDETVVDLAAFGASGETSMVPPPAAMPLDAEPTASPATAPEPPADTTDAAKPAAGDKDDDFDKLLAEMAVQKEQQAAEVERKKQELLAEEEPLGDLAALSSGEPADDAETPEEPATDDTGTDAEAEVAESTEFEAAEPQPTAPAAPQFKLDMVDVGNGPQVAFPAEVLAMALRPMVQKWLAENLPAVVDKLVKEEISKMTQS